MMVGGDDVAAGAELLKRDVGVFLTFFPLVYYKRRGDRMG